MNKKLITHLNRLITSSVYITYPIVLFYLVYLRDVRFWRVLLAPGISFVFVSIFRHYVNAPRPYEVADIERMIEKETTGTSLTSGDVFSIFVVATTLYVISKPLGILLLIAAASL